MRFLKVLFWLLLGGLVAGFVIYNGDERVNVHLWSGLIADFSLPLLLILVFLAGLLPVLLAYHALRWRMRQRITGLERALNDIRAINAMPEPVVVVPDPVPAPAAPQAALPLGDVH
ncbi:lipopolysaccharide assembly protein LapA domain-containing protein [Sphingomonas sp. KR3-1]|uniref:lipopolysaccharide assembly protein LapA domain-containing protein n=1 Tax=Sphingomonas sp. KR3-1 TaxID=3156611 RepID=UPI0032B581CB